MKLGSLEVGALRALGVTALVFCVLLAVLDSAVNLWFPRFERLSDNFSTAYLEREAGALAKDPPEIVFLGDSVFWGYRLRPQQSVVSLLDRAGLRSRNLSFEGGSPANTYAMLRLLEAKGVRPALVVFNVNAIGSRRPSTTRSRRTGSSTRCARISERRSFRTSTRPTHSTTPSKR